MSLTALGQQLAAMGPLQIRALAPSDIATLSADDLAALPTSLLNALTNDQIAAILPPTVAALDATTFDSLSRRQVLALTSAQLSVITPDQADTISRGELAAMTPAQIGAIDPDAFDEFGRYKIAALTPAQFAALSPEQVDTLTRGKISVLTGDQIAAIDPQALPELGPGRLSSLSATQIQALTPDQLSGLRPNELVVVIRAAVATGAWATGVPAAQLGAWTDLCVYQYQLLDSATISAMSPATFAAVIGPTAGFMPSLDAVSVAQLQALSPAQFAGLDGLELEDRGPAFLAQLNPALFTPDQAAEFSSATLAGLGASFISGLSDAALEAIKPTQVSGLSVDELSALNAQQLACFTSSQMLAMTDAQVAVVSNANPLLVEAVSLEVGGVFDSASAQALLRDAAQGGLSAAKLDQLKQIDAKLMTWDDAVTFGVDDALRTTADVKQLFHNVVGSVSATTTQADMDSAVANQFLGATPPSLDLGGGVSLASGYQLSSVQLLDGAGTMALTDIRQGALNDSAVLAGIAETLIQDPGYLQKLFTDEGGGVYRVEIPDLISPTYVTVDSRLPGAADGSAGAVANASTGEWAALLEKAAAVAAGGYGALAAQQDDTVFSGQYEYSMYLAGNEPDAMKADDLLRAATRFATHTNVTLEAASQFYAVTGIDTVNQSLSAYNPSTGAISSFKLADMAGDTISWGSTERPDA